MSKNRKTMYRAYVNHPRYGDRPISTNANFTDEDILCAHWQYDKESIFPDTAILADTSVQNYSMYPIKIYVDIEKSVWAVVVGFCFLHWSKNTGLRC